MLPKSKKNISKEKDAASYKCNPFGSALDSRGQLAYVTFATKRIGN
jgi:hypothetical protein